MLADRRLVEKTPRQGYVVRQLNLTEIHELYDLRLVLETYIMEQVCKTGMDEATLAALKRRWTQVYEALPEMIADPVTVDENFHQALARAVGNRAMAEMLGNIDARIRFVRMFDITNAERLKATCLQHLETLDAIERRDAGKAIDVLRRNIEGGRDSGRERRQGGSRERPCDLRLTEFGGPRRWDRTSRAANFRCAFTASFTPPRTSARRDGDLLTLLSAEADDCPRSVRLASVEDFSSLGLAAGDGGVFTVDAIVLERSAGRGRFRVDCVAARRLAAQPAPPLRGDGERWRAGVARLEALQERAATDLRIAPLLAGALPLGAMARATDAGRSGSRPRRAGRSPRRHARRGGAAGRPGPGLTPAGDDFLCGFLAAGHCRQAARMARALVLLTSFAEAVREFSDRRRTSAPRSCATPSRAHLRPLAALAEACGAPGSDLDGALLRLAASATAPAWTPRRVSSTARRLAQVRHARARDETLRGEYCREFAAAQSCGRPCGATIRRRRPGALA